MNPRTLTDTQISALDVGQINSGLIHPRADDGRIFYYIGE